MGKAYVCQSIFAVQGNAYVLLVYILIYFCVSVFMFLQNFGSLLMDFFYFFGWVESFVLVDFLLSLVYAIWSANLMLSFHFDASGSNFYIFANHDECATQKCVWSSADVYFSTGEWGLHK